MSINKKGQPMSMDILEYMNGDPKIFFWYNLRQIRKPGAVVEAQIAFDVSPTGTTAEGGQFLHRVIPETIRQLTVSDIDEYKAHRAIRKEAGYDYASVIDFFRQKYPTPKIVSNADADPIRIDEFPGDVAGGEGAAASGSSQSEPVGVLPAP